MVELGKAKRVKLKKYDYMLHIMKLFNSLFSFQNFIYNEYRG